MAFGPTPVGDTTSLSDNLTALGAYKAQFMENLLIKYPRRRTRMISFRVSEGEFEQLRTKSEAEGARSISDYARLALCGAGGVSSERLNQGISRLSDDVQQLKAEVRRVTESLEASGRDVQRLIR